MYTNCKCTYVLMLFSQSVPPFPSSPMPTSLSSMSVSALKMKVQVAKSCPTLCDSMDWPARLLCPWDSPGKNTGGGSLSLLQGILPTQGTNPGLQH